MLIKESKLREIIKKLLEESISKSGSMKIEDVEYFLDKEDDEDKEEEEINKVKINIGL